MSRNLINLLPPDRLHSFRREYFLRLATVVFFVLTFLVVVHGVLLVPSYLYLSSEESATQHELDSIADPATDSSGVTTELASLTSDANYLARLGSIPTASAPLRAVLFVPHAGITLTNISITPPAVAGGAGKLIISGEAATREALRAYDLALSSLPFVSNVDLPISAYAQTSNILFSMTLTGTLTP